MLQYENSKPVFLKEFVFGVLLAFLSVARRLGSRQADIYETSLPVIMRSLGIQHMKLLLQQGQCHLDISCYIFCKQSRFLQVVVLELFAFG